MKSSGRSQRRATCKGPVSYEALHTSRPASTGSAQESGHVEDNKREVREPRHKCAHSTCSQRSTSVARRYTDPGFDGEFPLVLQFCTHKYVFSKHLDAFKKEIQPTVLTDSASMLSSKSRKDGVGSPALVGTDSRTRMHRSLTARPATDWVSREREQTHNQSAQLFLAAKIMNDE